MGITGFDREGTLTVDGFSLTCPAWTITSDEEGRNGLWSLRTLFDTRGENRVIPGAAGSIPYPRRWNESRRDLNLLVVGDVDRFGAPYADARLGLETNLAYLRTNVFATPITATRTAIISSFSGSPITGAIQIIGLQEQRWIFDDEFVFGAFLGTLQVILPNTVLV